MGEFKNTEKFIINYANQVEQEIENRLSGHGKIASGELYDSIRYEIKEDKKKIILTFKMASYGKYVDEGTDPSTKYPGDGKGTGKSAFIESLMKWCRIKGLPEGAAFPIRRKIWETGLPSTYFFTIPIKRRQKQYEAGVRKAMILDTEQILTKEFKRRGR